MNPHLSLFLTVSLAAHAGVLLWRPPVPLPEIGGQPRALRVSLAPATPVGALAALDVAPRTSPRQTATTPATAPTAAPAATRPAHTTAAPPVAIAATAGAAPARTPPVETATAPPQHPEPGAPAPGAGASDVNQRISAALQSELASHFEYPWLARKRGWQGQVTLSLRVHGNGELSDWGIFKTSGYPLLDRSALRAARAIGQLPGAGRLLHGQSLELQIPVHYRLLDG